MPSRAQTLAQIGDVAELRTRRAGLKCTTRSSTVTRRNAWPKSKVVALPNSTWRDAEQRVGEALEHPLDHVHEVAVVRVGLVQLEHRELGVVPRRQPLVAEIAVDLVDALEAAHDEPLQIQLGCDAQVHVEVERVVMRDERPRHRAARDRLHHRRLDFHEPERVEELSQVLHDAGARAEHLAALVVHDQVDVALPVAQLLVGEPVPLVRQRTQ